MKKNEVKLLVMYIAVGDLADDVNIRDYVNSVAAAITPTTFEGEIIILPISGSDSRVECINPKYITDITLINEHQIMMRTLNDEIQNQINELKNK